MSPMDGYAAIITGEDEASVVEQVDSFSDSVMNDMDEKDGKSRLLFWGSEVAVEELEKHPSVESVKRADPFNPNAEE